MHSFHAGRVSENLYFCSPRGSNPSPELRLHLPHGVELAFIQRMQSM